MLPAEVEVTHFYGTGYVREHTYHGSSILGWIPIQIRIQGFNEQKVKKKFAAKKSWYNFDQKLQFSYP